MNVYETDELLGQYLAFHFGDSHFGVGNYPARCAGVCLELMAGREKKRALDLGCAVGRTSFELGRAFEEVVGLDLSNRFIHAAQTMKSEGAMDYFLRDQGDLGSTASASLEAHNLGNAAARVQFQVADACSLGPEHEDYDLVFAGNLIDRLQDPGAFLQSVHRLLKPGGVLVISSPYTLMEDFTPRANWIGGFELNGEPVTVLDGMRSILAPRFEQMQNPVDIPFVIRETARKYQHTIAELSAWQRRV
ncbi:putative 4-mercaptohistidine N1-methyltranferase [Marinobacter daqiaonensis]|uniref:Putative 4-mercaptohistidine N1-methyltranferase n=1 Tax=Marinobacter daqiaonensis TaxID=650891 RepID=A0A1I6JTT4_9GAMM|nr:putative 4-mercaptohistidine N1-methyltransferase [Marinobacter daqiaonensis]SFR82394.1 putative 4-mercaptohistidine N1-methyltranferase [Marinobacter daqiaonensis]